MDVTAERWVKTGHHPPPPSPPTVSTHHHCHHSHPTHQYHHHRRRMSHTSDLYHISQHLNWIYIMISFFFIATHLLAVQCEENKIYHISTLCLGDRPAPLYKKIDGAVLTSESENKLDCIVTFQTDSILQRFMLRFERLALDCNDHLYVYDGAHAYGKAKVDLSCRSTKSDVGTIFTESNYVTLRYVTDDWSNEGNGFQLVITAYKDQSVACSAPGGLKCRNSFCIPEDLACDSVNHCGDNSDEAPHHPYCLAADGSSGGMGGGWWGPGQLSGLGRVWGVDGHVVLAVLATLFILLMICIMAVAVCLCRRDLASHHAAHLAGLNGGLAMNPYAQAGQTVSLAAGPYGSQRFALQNATSSPALAAAAAAHQAAYLNSLGFGTGMPGGTPTGNLITGMGPNGGGVMTNGVVVGMNGINGMNGMNGQGGTPTGGRFSTLPLPDRTIVREKPPPYSPVLGNGGLPGQRLGNGHVMVSSIGPDMDPNAVAVQQHQQQILAQQAAAAAVAAAAAQHQAAQQAHNQQNHSGQNQGGFLNPNHQQQNGQVGNLIITSTEQYYTK